MSSVQATQVLLHRRVRDQLRRERIDIDALVTCLREVAQGRSLGRYGVRMLRLRGAKYLVFEATQALATAPALIVDAPFVPMEGVRVLFTIQPTHVDAGPGPDLGLKLRYQVVVWDIGRRRIDVAGSSAPEGPAAVARMEGLTLESAREGVQEESPVSALPEYAFVPLQVVEAAARDVVLGHYLDPSLLGEDWWIEQGAAADRESLIDAQEILEVDVAALDATLRKWAEGKEDCYLHLLPEQLRWIDVSGPLLLGGSVGSGKTTILLYHLLKRAAQDAQGRYLLVSYSPELSHYCDYLLARLPEGAALRPHIEIMSFAALVQRLSWEGNPAAPSFVAFTERRRQFMAFYAELPRRWAIWHSGRRPVAAAVGRRPVPSPVPEEIAEHPSLPWDAETLWAELWDTYKGQLTLQGRERLSARSYVEQAASDLPARRLAAFVFEEFRALHPEPDELDACHRLHGAALRARLPRYDGIYVDEAQDLCEVQWQLLLEMLRTPRGLVMTGDPFQTLRPSGFHWNRLRKRLGQRVTVEEGWLSLNLRNSRHIAEYVSACMATLAARWEIDAPRYTVAAVLEGARVAVAASTFTSAQAAAWLGDQGVALVLDEAARTAPRAAALKAAGVPVLTVLEAKGLEFDRVLLCDFFTAIEQALSTAPDSVVLRHTVLGHLYVALTRARRGLVLLEKEAESLPARELLVPLTPGWLSAWERVAPVSQSGVRFLSSNEVREARAEHAEATGQQREAAALYASSGRDAEVARCFERLGELADAAAAYDRAGQPAAAERCHGRREEAAGQLLAAAAHYAQAGMPLDSARCLEAGGQLHEAAALWEREDRQEDAARCYHAVNNFIAAQLCMARHYEAQATIASAAENRQHSGEPEGPGLYRAAAIRYAAAGAYADAGRCYLQADEPWMFGESYASEAAKCFQRAGLLEEAERAYQRAGLHGEVVLLKEQILAAKRLRSEAEEEPG